MKIGIIIIHGMGNHSIGYSVDFQKKILARYKGSDDLIFKEVLWEDVIKNKETGIFEKIRSELDYNDLRKLFINYVGDVIAYQKTNNPNDSYNLINNKIFDKYSELKNQLTDDDKIIFVVHSLGGVILNNFIYDFQNSENPIKFNTLITFGTVLALWSLKYQNMDQPIKLNKNQKWINIYDKDDILAYPLSDISTKYKEYSDCGSLTDIELNVGGLLVSWNPLSHNAYWLDNEFIDIISETF